MSFETDHILHFKCNENHFNTSIYDAVGTLAGISARDSRGLHCDGKYLGGLKADGYFDTVTLTGTTPQSDDFRFWSLWIYIDTWVDNAVIFRIGSGASCQELSLDGANAAAGKLALTVWTEEPSSFTMNTVVGDVLENKWYHLFFHWEVGTPGSYYVYLDSVLNISGLAGASDDEVSAVSGGFLLDDDTGSNKFTGRIDDFRIVDDRALDTDEIDILFNGGAGYDGYEVGAQPELLIGHLIFNDQNDGKKVVDHSGYNSHGTMFDRYNKNCSYIAPTEKCHYFDGAEYMDVAEPYKFGDRGAFTVTVNVKPTDAGVGRPIYEFSETAGVQTFGLEITGTKFHFELWEDDRTKREITADAVYVVDTWYQVVVTYDGATLKMYIDGVLQASTVSFAGVLDSVTFGIFGVDKQYHGFYFTGYINDFRFYNYAFDQDEVNALGAIDFKAMTFGVEGETIAGVS